MYKPDLLGKKAFLCIQIYRCRMKDSGDKTTPKGCVKDRKGKKKKISKRTKLERKNEIGTGTRG